MMAVCIVANVWVKPARFLSKTACGLPTRILCVLFEGVAVMLAAFHTALVRNLVS